MSGPSNAGTGPGVNIDSTTREKMQETLPTYLKDRESKRKETEQRISGKIQGWTAGNTQCAHCGGRDEGLYSQEQNQAESDISKNFTTCQRGHAPHTELQMWIPDMNIPLFFTGPCSEWHTFIGIPSGLCLRIVSKPPFCPVYQIWSTMVEYSYPTTRWEVSERPGQTALFTKSQVESGFQQNEQFYNEAPKEVKNTIDYAVSRASNGTSPNTSKVESTARDAIRDGIKKVNSEVLSDPWKRFAAPDQSLSYPRMVAEKRELVSWMLRWIPHNPAFLTFAMDIPPGFVHSKAVSKSLMDFKRALVYSMYGAEVCVSNNKIATSRNMPRTPSDILKYPAARSEEVCVPNIGPNFPYTERTGSFVYRTDRTWTGLKRGLELLNTWQGFTNMLSFQFGFRPMGHSYERDIDKFLVLGDEDLRADSEQEKRICYPIKGMTEKPWFYNKANTKKELSGGRAWGTEFTVFKGCWGFKGDGESTWTKLFYFPKSLVPSLIGERLRLD